MGRPRVSGSLKQSLRTGPLAGYRILEFGANFTGPFATMLLGDQGADVIKVESPQGDQIRYSTSARGGISAAFLSTNRNKRSVVLDLKKPAAIAAFRRLVKSCDVVVQNFRPGVVDRLGLGYDDLRKVRDDLIFVSVSGFGSDGPYSKQRVYDTVIQGVAGIAGTQRDPDTGVPCMVRSAIVDKVTALTVAQAITAGLLARERSGKGQHVRVDMLNAMLSFWWPDVMSNQTFIGTDRCRYHRGRSPDLQNARRLRTRSLYVECRVEGAGHCDRKAGTGG